MFTLEAVFFPCGNAFEASRHYRGGSDSRWIHTVEVTGSNPVLPTSRLAPEPPNCGGVSASPLPSGELAMTDSMNRDRLPSRLVIGVAFAAGAAIPAHAQITWTDSTTGSGLGGDVVYGASAAGSTIYVGQDASTTVLVFSNMEPRVRPFGR
jgi:hypothetical protein